MIIFLPYKLKIIFFTKTIVLIINGLMEYWFNQFIIYQTQSLMSSFYIF